MNADKKEDLSKSFLVNLLTPIGTLLKNEKCDEVIVPLTTGEVDLLPGHERLIGQVMTGILTVKSADKIRRFLVTHGICKVEEGVVTILSTTSETEENINLERAQIALKKAQNKLLDIAQLSNDEALKYQRKLARAESRIMLSYLRK